MKASTNYIKAYCYTKYLNVKNFYNESSFTLDSNHDCCCAGNA